MGSQIAGYDLVIELTKHTQRLDGIDALHMAQQATGD